MGAQRSGDRLLSDAEWTEVVEDLMDRTGIAVAMTPVPAAGAVRQAGDHIHGAAVLIRTDGGRRVHVSNGYYRARGGVP